MKFSQKFLIVNFVVLAFVVSSNIVALKYFSGLYFTDYVSEIKKDSSKNQIDYDTISKLLDNNVLDQQTLDEYKKITSDLSTISSSLEKFSKDPQKTNTSLLETLQKIGLPSSSIEKMIGVNALQSFFSNIGGFFTLDLSAPEGVFVLKTLKSMVWFNFVLILFISIVLYLWIRFTFRPIQHIISNLSNIIYKKQYKNILYNRKDEFSTLIEGINNLNKSLSLQEKIRSDFLSDLSHEIKTPITAVKCYLEAIEDGVISLDEKNIKLLHSEIDRLIKITNLIMEFEKEESKKFGDIFISKNDLVEMLEFTSLEYTNDLAKNKQSISFNKDKPFYINADKDKITQIIHNIFSNFIKYSGKGTLLSITFVNKKNLSVITFKDNGIGISKDELPFIKEKFYKIEKSRMKNNDNGVGIGLSVVDKIVKLHNGNFDIVSDIKKGLEIRITLPK
ncbi:MAG: HAMP domain-containing sensor histidine kinase [Candidatus Gracilibacteria bacterium]|nr:HAMP domain-containing sensor histidine kinase [Candidatus Gracilibacteria bacterium]